MPVTLNRRRYRVAVAPLAPLAGDPRIKSGGDGRSWRTIEEIAMSDMTISDIRVIPLRVPWVDPPVFGKTRVTAPRDILVVEVETRSGLVGIGYLHLLSPSLRTIATCLDEAIVPHLIGRDATAIEAIWRDLWRTTYSAGRMGIAVMAISAIDIALWDLVGKQANMPLHRLWGHFRSEIPAYGSGC